MFRIGSLKSVCVVIFVFISFFGIGQGRNGSKELYHPKSPKDLKQALKRPLKAKNVTVIYGYTDTIFPSESLLTLKNVEHIDVSRPYFGGRVIKKAKSGEAALKPYPKVRIDTVALKQFGRLKYLRFFNFDFDNFPAGICVLRHLRGLVIDFCSVDTVPKEIGKMTNLVALGLCLNNIQFLPKEISRLDSLRYLDLANNAFSAFPLELISCKKLETVDLTNREQSFEDTQGTMWPYTIHSNKILLFPNQTPDTLLDESAKKKRTTVFLDHSRKIFLEKQ